jgi:hypothetical protein
VRMLAPPYWMRKDEHVYVIHIARVVSCSVPTFAPPKYKQMRNKEERQAAPGGLVVRRRPLGP